MYLKTRFLHLIDLLQTSKAENKVIPENILVGQIVAINNLLIDVRSESYSMSKTLEVLEKALPTSDEDKERFKALRTRIRNAIKVTENTLAEYYILRLKLLSKSITEKRRDIEETEKATEEFRQEVIVLREELEKTKGLWNRTVKAQDGAGRRKNRTKSNSGIDRGNQSKRNRDF